MTVYYHKDEPLNFVTLPDSIHDLEEEINGAAADKNYREQFNNIFLTLYRDKRFDDIEYLLTRHFFSEKEIDTAIERLGVKVKEMEADPDYN